MFVILMVFFIQTVIIPFMNGLGIITVEAGSPTAWVLSGAGAVFSWIFIKMLLWNVKRERTYV
jgi:hypothetical protein